MKFDFNQILDVVRPETFEITYGDNKSYKLRRLMTAEVKNLETVNQPREGEDGLATGQRMIDFARSLFDENGAPPFLHVTLRELKDSEAELNEAIMRVSAFFNTLNAWLEDQNEQLGNFAARVRRAATTQIEATRAAAETDSTT